MNNEFYAFGPHLDIDTPVVQLSAADLNEEGGIVFDVQNHSDTVSLTSNELQTAKDDEGVLVSTQSIDETDEAWEALLNYNNLYDSGHPLSTEDQLTSKLKELFRSTANALAEGE